MDQTPLGYFHMVLTQELALILRNVFVCHQQLVRGFRWRITHTEICTYMKKMVIFTLVTGLL